MIETLMASGGLQEQVSWMDKRHFEFMSNNQMPNHPENRRNNVSPRDDKRLLETKYHFIRLIP
jgi:hypothetical protein